jgi:integrase
MTTDLKATKKNLPAARDELAAHRLEIRGRRSRVPEDVPFGRAVERFLDWSEVEHREHPATAKRQAVSLASSMVFFGESTMLHVIRPGDVEDYKVTRMEQGVADVTVRKDLHALSQLFQFAMKHRWIDANPLEGVKIPSDRDSRNERTIDEFEEALYFTEALRQAETASTFAGPVLHDVCRVMIWQGLRPAEALSLTKRDVDLKEHLLFVCKGKSRAAKRELHLMTSAVELLAPRMKRRYEHLFPGGRRNYNGKPYSYSGLVNAHNAVFAALNREALAQEPPAPLVIEPFDLYSLRHTFATRFYEATKDLDKLARILGHGSLATVRRYINPTNDDIHEAMELFEASQQPSGLVVQGQAEVEDQPTIH